MEKQSLQEELLKLQEVHTFLQKEFEEQKQFVNKENQEYSYEKQEISRQLQLLKDEVLQAQFLKQKEIEKLKENYENKVEQIK